MLEERLIKLKNKFIDLYGISDKKIRFFSAPGRVNLIGEHIDYCGGYVFPSALTLDHIVAIRENDSNYLRLAATDLVELYTVDLNNIDAAKSFKWGNYQAGMAKELISMGVDVKGSDMLFDGNIPYGAGLSSSASIEVCTGYALYKLYSEKEISLIDIALAGKRCENNFCGVNCGIMDQFASAMGKKDHAILLNCDTLEYEYVPLELGDYLLVLANTNVKHALGTSKYNERRHEVDLGLEIMHKAYPNDKRPYLCNYTHSEFIAAQNQFTDETIKKRVLHVISENERVKEAVSLLKNNKLVEFGHVLCKANDSIRYLYEVTGLELDAMYDIAVCEDGCIGARMTGAGFGGCTVNIVHKNNVDGFIKNVGAKYKEITGNSASFYICSSGDGAKEISN